MKKKDSKLNKDKEFRRLGLLQDYIDRQGTIDSIYQIIGTLKSYENKRVCLFGEWGCGKSYALDLLNKKLIAQKNWEKQYIIVRYDAWKNSFYSDPLIAMIYCIIDTIKSQYSESYKEIRKQSWRSMGWKRFLSLVNDLSADSDSVYIGKIVKALFSIAGFVKGCRGIDIPDEKRYGDFESYNRLLEIFLKIVNDITHKKTNYAPRGRKLIIFVDEIDRCLPDDQFRLLECTNNLFKITNCVIVYSLNLNESVKYYNYRYGTENGRHYFEKLFGTVMFELPPDTKVLFQRRIDDIFIHRYDFDVDTNGSINLAKEKNLGIKEGMIWLFVCAEAVNNIQCGESLKSLKLTMNSSNILYEKSKGFNNRQASKFLDSVSLLMNTVFASTDDKNNRWKPSDLYDNNLGYVYAFLMCQMYALKLFEADAFEQIKNGEFDEYQDFIGIYRGYVEKVLNVPNLKDYDDAVFKVGKPIPITQNGPRSSTSHSVMNYSDNDLNLINFVLNSRSEKVFHSPTTAIFLDKLNPVTNIDNLREVLSKMITEIDFMAREL